MGPLVGLVELCSDRVPVAVSKITARAVLLAVAVIVDVMVRLSVIDGDGDRVDVCV